MKEKNENEKKVVFRVEDGMNREDILCTTYQMRNFYMQFKDGFFSNLDVMNYIQHHAVALMAKKNANVLDVCCGRSLVLPLLRYYSSDINSYTGVDICESNINEAKKGASTKTITPEMLENGYYSFKTDWILSDVAVMSEKIKKKSMDLVIYTSALEHMHKDKGSESLKECYKVMKDNGLMFLSCPNTPGNGYETQYRAHVYEWGYDELKDYLESIGFEIVAEYGLVMKVKKLKEFFASSEVSQDLKDLFNKCAEYMPSAWLSAFFAIPYPKIADEILFVVKKKDPNESLLLD